MKYPECELCVKFHLVNCEYVNAVQKKNSEAIFTPFGESTLFFFASGMEFAKFDPEKSFEEYIEQAKKAISIYPNRDSIVGHGCDVARTIALELENHLEILQSIGCAINVLLKQPKVSLQKSQKLYGTLDAMVDRFSIENNVLNDNTASVFSSLVPLREKFYTVYQNFASILEKWIEYSRTQATTNRKAAQDWFAFVPILIRIIELFSIQYAFSVQKSGKANRVEFISTQRKNYDKISFLEDQYIQPYLEYLSNDIEICNRLIDIGKAEEHINGHQTLDFINSLATSQYLLINTYCQRFEVCDKTYVFTNAFKSIEELISCCLIMINESIEETDGIYISCHVGGSLVNFDISDVDSWLNKATLGNLAHAIKHISDLYGIETNLFDDIQEWTNTCRNGYFHKHGLVFSSLSEMISGEVSKNIPPADSFFKRTIELAANIISWMATVIDTY